MTLGLALAIVIWTVALAVLGHVAYLRFVVLPRQRRQQRELMQELRRLTETKKTGRD